MTSYLLAGGGTAGHVNPLLAVDKVPFPRRPNAQAAAFPARFRRAIAQVRAHIRQHGIDVVVGFGGYASAPAYVAARRERVPFVVPEANAKPGLANVLGARAAAGVGVAFVGTPLRGSEVVGMPLRREVITLDRVARRAEAAEYFGLDPDRPVLLVFGGSLGAQRLNDALADSWRDILAAGWQLLHGTGERSDLPDPGVAGYALRRYVDRMDLAFALADLIVSRSGSATVSEISALGIPALYVPYSVGNGEQRLNAGSAVAAGAAQLLDDATFDGDAVRRIVVPLLGDPDRIRRMAEAAETAGTRTGTENVVAMIDRALGAA